MNIDSENGTLLHWLSITISGPGTLGHELLNMLTSLHGNALPKTPFRWFCLSSNWSHRIIATNHRQVYHIDWVTLMCIPAEKVGQYNKVSYQFSELPPPPLANSRDSARRSPGWGGGDGRQVTVSGGGGGDCKGISRQAVVPSTDASKENTCEATFALMRCQRVSSNTNLIEDPKER